MADAENYIGLIMEENIEMEKLSPTQMSCFSMSETFSGNGMSSYFITVLSSFI